MSVKIVILSLVAIALVKSFEIVDIFSSGNYETITPQGVFRRDPCGRPGARQFEPNPRGCSWFWECKNNASEFLYPPNEGKCPYDLHFEASPLGCVYPENKTNPCTFDDDNFEDSQKDCIDWDPMQLLPHQFECDKFRVCWENITIIKNCPDGKEFSYFDNDCVDPYLADCRVVDNYCRSFGKAAKSKRDPYSCTRYHVCSECNGHSGLIELSCNESSHYYNDELNHCTTNDTIASCEPLKISSDPGLPTPLSIDCPDLSNTLIKHNDTSNQFYFYCSAGRSTLRQCQGNHTFVENRRNCYPPSS